MTVACWMEGRIDAAFSASAPLMRPRFGFGRVMLSLTWYMPWRRQRFISVMPARYGPLSGAESSLG